MKYKITKDLKSKKYILEVGYKPSMWGQWTFTLAEHFDPFHNRRIYRADALYAWKFNTKEEAEQLLSIAILRGIL